MNANTIICKHCSREVITGGTALPNICLFCEEPIEAVDAESFVCDFTDCFIIPFPEGNPSQTISHNIFKWLVEKSEAPDDILENCTFNGIYGIYLPIWHLSGSFKAHWNASCGYYKTEEYTAYETTYENGKSKKVKVTKTRTITNWKPASGKVIGDFFNCGIDTDLFDDEMLQFCEATSLDINKIISFNVMHIEGYRLLSFRSDYPNNVYEARIKSKIQKSIERKVSSAIPGDTRKDENWDSDIELKTSRPIYHPFWLAHYDHMGYSYLIMIDGTNNHRIGGAYPIEDAKSRKSPYNKSFIPFWASIATFATTIAYSHLNTHQYDLDNFIKMFKIFAPILLTTYAYGFFRNVMIRKKKRKFRESSLNKAIRENVFIYGN